MFSENLEICLRIPGLNEEEVVPRVFTQKIDELSEYIEKMQLYILNSQSINTIANFLESEVPNTEWIKQEAERLKETPRRIENFYSRFRSDMTKYLISSGQLLSSIHYNGLIKHGLISKGLARKLNARKDTFVVRPIDYSPNETVLIWSFGKNFEYHQLYLNRINHDKYFPIDLGYILGKKI